jgi:hypothetical protein
VTTAVGALTENEVAEALALGLAEAEKLRRAGLVEASALFLNGEARVCGVIANISRPAIREGNFAYA